MAWPQFKDHNGHACTYPKAKEEALQKGLSKYLRPKDSPRCPNDNCTVLYVENDECLFCFVKREWDRIRIRSDIPTRPGMCDRLGTDFFYTSSPCLEGAHLIAAYKDGRRGCAICKSQLSPRQDAIRKGEAKYTPKKACDRCGQRALKSVQNGQCDGCRPPARDLPSSPRQLAFAAGDAKYMPNEPCFRCGELALKRVDNGRCDGCYPPKGLNKMDEPTRVLMENAPYTVINRNLAITMGLTAYRIGQYCLRGHDGWRYVSTRQCITCHRGRNKTVDTV